MSKQIKLDALLEAQKNLEKEIALLQATIKPYVKFPFFIDHQASDGFVIVHEDTDENGMLSPCIKHINENGKLTYEDYKSRYSI